MTWKPCIDCGTPSPGTRCPDCAAARDRARPPSPSTATRTARERRRRARTVRAWRRHHGDWCPGYGDQPPHEAALLTADHITAVSLTGDQSDDLQVLCLHCNSAKGASQ